MSFALIYGLFTTENSYTVNFTDFSSEVSHIVNFTDFFLWKSSNYRWDDTCLYLADLNSMHTHPMIGGMTNYLLLIKSCLDTEKIGFSPITSNFSVHFTFYYNFLRFYCCCIDETNTNTVNIEGLLFLYEIHIHLMNDHWILREFFFCVSWRNFA